MGTPAAITLLVVLGGVVGGALWVIYLMWAMVREERRELLDRIQAPFAAPYGSSEPVSRSEARGRTDDDVDRAFLDSEEAQIAWDADLAAHLAHRARVNEEG